MKIGDLITYVDSSGHIDYPPDLGIVTKDDHYENKNYYYIVWLTAENQGWWDKACLRVVSKNENR